MREYVVNMPTWALSYIFNGDNSSLEEDEIAMVDQWVEDNPGLYSLDGEDSYFSRYPEFGLACDCEDLTVTIIGSING